VLSQALPDADEVQSVLQQLRSVAVPSGRQGSSSTSSSSTGSKGPRSYGPYDPLSPLPQEALAPEQMAKVGKQVAERVLAHVVKVVTIAFSCLVSSYGSQHMPRSLRCLVHQLAVHDHVLVSMSLHRMSFHDIARTCVPCSPQKSQFFLHHPVCASLIVT
jgi:hypothetical protein